MALVLACRRNFLSHSVVARSPSVCEQRRHYVAKPEKRKSKAKAKKSEASRKEQINPETDTKDVASVIEYLGLGKTDGSADWRDQKLEAKVTELFLATLQWTGEAGAKLHPEDEKIMAEAEAAQERLAHRLSEIRHVDYQKSIQIITLLLQNKMKEQMQSVNELNESAIPGAGVAPWSGNLVWKKVLKNIPVLGNPEGGQVNPLLNDGTEYGPGEDKDEEQDGSYVDSNGDVKRLEPLDNPLVWHDSKTNKKQCIFCSEDRHQYPLEPMNVPLLMQFMTPGGFIKKRKQTGLCRSMQARVARTIKQSRHLGLFSYKGCTFTVKNPMITQLQEDEPNDEDYDGFESPNGEEFEQENQEFDEAKYRSYLDQLSKSKAKEEHQ